MYDYSKQLQEFRCAKVRLTASLKQKLFDHRRANRERLSGRIADHLPKAKVSDSSFRPQGSMAMGTTIQTKFEDEEYDIDDGLLISLEQLKDEDGEDLGVAVVRNAVLKSLEDSRFKKQPKLCSNCVRVFYADEGKEKHHVDVAIYRTSKDEDGEPVQELANEDAWVESNPTQVNAWFEKVIKDKNSEESGWGTQLRQLVQLLKRLCRSRKSWLDLLPNGMKLTMLVAECLPEKDERIDLAFRALLEALSSRLATNKVIRNLAHPDEPEITRGSADKNVVELERRVNEVVEKLGELDDADNDKESEARRVWDWIFQSDGFFAELADDSRQLEISWCEPPRWPLVLEAEVSISASWSDGENNWVSFANDSAALPKLRALRFQATTSAPKPFSVFWQVVNTGADAMVDDGMRGEILESKTAGAGGLRRDEATLYRGSHWIECFIVRAETCVARSGRFIVNIC